MYIFLRLVSMKGKGSLLTFWLTGEESGHRERRVREKTLLQPGSPCFLRSVSQHSSFRVKEQSRCGRHLSLE